MLLALTDHLRCTGDHAETWLVARADTAEHGWMVHGVLGCPVCRVERDIRGGVVYWSAEADRAAPNAPQQLPRPRPRPRSPGDEAVIRLAALLALTESRAPYVLCGAAGACATALGELATVRLVQLDPYDDSDAGLVTVIRGAPRVPFGERSVQGIALDGVHAAADRIDFAVRSLVPGGRMVADASIPVPPGITELARDEAQWVGERVAEAVPVALRRAGALA